MSRVTALLTVSIVVFAAIGFAAFFPTESQRILFNIVFTTYKLKHEYFLKDATPQSSAGAKAFDDMFSAVPLPQDLATVRKMLDGFEALNPLSSIDTITEVTLRSDLKAYWAYNADADEANGPVILYLHGGAFVAGSVKSHLGFAAEIAKRVKGRAFFVDYRLAPEHILPAATDDAVLAYRWLVDVHKVNPKRIAIVGDSAGGGLVFLTLLALNQEEHSRFVTPGAAVAISAWTDLLSLPDGRPSYQKNKDKDVVLTKEWLLDYASQATATQPNENDKRKSPKFSPIYANLEGQKFPPVFMQVGSSEILRDDTVHFFGKAKQASIDVTLEELEERQHNAAMAFSFYPEAEKALNSIVEFIVAHIKA